jgi:hypothetical protein
MNRIFIAIVIFIVIILGYAIEDAVGDVSSSGSTTSSQSTTGAGSSNTHISGGYSSETNFQNGSSSNTTNNSTTNNNNRTETAVNPANAPSMSVYGTGGDSCSLVVSSGISVLNFSISGGGYVLKDEQCERLKKAKMMKALGMTVASISIMCLDYDVWLGMKNSNTPCPIDGLIGEDAKKRWEEVGGFYRDIESKDQIEQYKKYKHSLRR